MMARKNCLASFALLALLVHAAAAPVARGADRDPRIDKLVSGGLDWIASTQSRLGHWSANEGRYPTAMTALAGVALAERGFHDHAGQVRQEHPHGRRLSALAQPAQRAHRRSRTRRPLHLRPRLLDVVPLAGAGRGRGRQPAQGIGRRALPRRRVHRPGANHRRRLGLREREGRQRLRRRLDHDHAGARAARLPQCRHYGAQGNCRRGGRVHPQMHLARRRSTIQFQGRWRTAGHFRGRHCLSVQCRRVRQPVRSQAGRVLPPQPGRHFQPGLRSLALRPLLLRPGALSRGRSQVGRVPRQAVCEAGLGGHSKRQIRRLESRLHRPHLYHRHQSHHSAIGKRRPADLPARSAGYNRTATP